MIDRGLASTGWLPIGAPPDLLITLLEQVRLRLGRSGFEYKGLVYANPELQPYLDLRPPFGDERHVVFVHPGDLSRIWFFAYNVDDPRRGRWIPIPTRRLRAAYPFNDAHLDFAVERLMGLGRPRPTPEDLEAQIIAIHGEIKALEHRRRERLMRGTVRAFSDRAMLDAAGLSEPAPAFYADLATAFDAASTDREPPPAPWQSADTAMPVNRAPLHDLDPVEDEGEDGDLLDYVYRENDFWAAAEEVDDDD